MSTAAGLVARVEVRRRWPALLGMALLVALVSGVVLTAVVGARRTSTTVSRFRTWSHASDVSYQSSDPGQADAILAAIDRLPEVEVATQRQLVNGFPADPSIPDIAIYSDPTGVYGAGLDGPRLLAGRLPAVDAADEVLLSETGARLTGRGVGDRLRVRTWSREDLIALFDSAAFPGFNGPAIDLRVVGVGRFPEELPGDVRRGAVGVLAAPAFLAAHPGAGAWPPSVVARLRDGQGDIDAVSRVVSPLLGLDAAAPVEGSRGIATTAGDVYLDTSQQAVVSLAVGLLLLAAAAATAGALAIGQAIARQLSSSASAAEVLGSLGATRAEIARARALPVVASVVVGVVCGGAAAVAASPLLPTGLAGRAEIERGLRVDPALLVVAAVAMVMLMAWWSLRAAPRADRHASELRLRGRRPSAIARLATRGSAPPAVSVGLHLAIEPGGGSGTVPVRSAVLGLAVGLAGLLGAGVIITSLDTLTGEPARWGWGWSSLPDYFGDGDPAALQDRLLDDPRVAAVGTLTTGSVLLGGNPVSGFALTALKGDMTFVRRAGRLPSGAAEVALGEQTMRELHLRLGGSVEAAGAAGEPSRSFTVVGSVVLPPQEEYTLDVGAVFTPEGLQTVDQGDPLDTLALKYPAGADPRRVEADLTADYGLQFGVFTKPQAPGSIRNLAEGRYVAISLAGFFSALGAAGLFHALLVSTRRRRSDLAVLRTLGFRPVQVRGAVLTQAVVLALEATIVGVPAGLIAGRLVWRALVSHLGALADPQVPWLLVALSAPAVALLALALAWWPARAAAHGSPAGHLRSE